MATRNIQMNYYNGTNYDVLYPQSTISQISNLQSSLNSKLNLSGGTMIGNLTLRGDPTSNLMAATKQYVDNNIETSIIQMEILTTVATGPIELEVTSSFSKIIWVCAMAKHSQKNNQGAWFCFNSYYFSFTKNENSNFWFNVLDEFGKLSIKDNNKITLYDNTGIIENSEISFIVFGEK